MSKNNNNHFNCHRPLHSLGTCIGLGLKEKIKKVSLKYLTRSPQFSLFPHFSFLLVPKKSAKKRKGQRKLELGMSLNEPSP